MAEVLAWIAANPGTTAAIAGTAETARKTSKAGSIQRDFQEREARKAEKKSRDLEAKNLMIRQQEAKRKEMTQVKSPFARKNKPTVGSREYFTIKDSGDSGVSY